MRRARYPLVAVFLIMFVLCVGLAWIGTGIRDAGRQRESIAALRKMDATVRFGKNQNPGLRQRLLSSWIASEGFRPIDSITFSGVVFNTAAHIADEDLKHFQGLSTVKFISLRESKVTGQGLAYLCDLNLQELYLGASLGIDDGAAGTLNDLTTLRELYVNSTSLGDAGLSKLTELRNLETLCLSSTDVTGKGIGALGNFHQLRHLDLSYTKLRNSDLEHIRIPTIEELDLSGIGSRYFGDPTIGIGDAGMSEIVKLTRIRVLRLDDTDITDRGIKEIVSLRSLETLSLNGTAVTDESISSLSALPRLKDVNLAHTKVTAKGIAQLQQRLPNALISSDVLD